MKTPTSALVQLLLLLTYMAHGVVAEPPSRTSVPQMGASSSAADAQERLSMLLANDGDPKGAVVALRRALELRAPSDVVDLARAKRTLANLLADFGDGFTMQMPEEFESLEHARDADTTLSGPGAVAGVADASTPRHSVFTSETGWGIDLDHSRRGEDGGAAGRMKRAGWEREFLMERETRRAEAERRASVEQEQRRLELLHGGRVEL
mmetsp:Transcript_43025/g.69182  ORF Transcript_43025/g.69182 Transcript_43025/m.69182 type:complete len:208 (-) Transcript_43025:330-953(-)